MKTYMHSNIIGICVGMIDFGNEEKGMKLRVVSYEGILKCISKDLVQEYCIKMLYMLQFDKAGSWVRVIPYIILLCMFKVFYRKNEERNLLH